MSKEEVLVDVYDLDKCPHCDAEWKYEFKHPDDEKSSVAGQTRTYSRLIGLQYSYDDPNHYDGVSEWVCPDCRIRWGRWSMKVLKEDESERRYGE